MCRNVLLLVDRAIDEVAMVIPADLLRRAGMFVTIATFTDIQLKGQNGVSFSADVPFHKVSTQTFDAVIITGDTCLKHLLEDQKAKNWISRFRGQVLAIGDTSLAAQVHRLFKPGIENKNSVHFRHSLGGTQTIEVTLALIDDLNPHTID